MECSVVSLRLLYWVRETDDLQCNRCTGRTAPGRWPAAPWSSRCLLRETGFTLRAFVSGTARPGSASTARQSEELRLRQVSRLRHSLPCWKPEVISSYENIMSILMLPSTSHLRCPKARWPHPTLFHSVFHILFNICSSVSRSFKLTFFHKISHSVRATCPTHVTPFNLFI